MPRHRGMTNKQMRFADEYLVDLNATQACIRAGYSQRNADKIGSQLLQKPLVREYINKRMAEKEDELIASQDEVLRYLTAVMRGESQAEIVVVEGVGDGVSEARHLTKKPSEQERTKAAELLAKRYGLLNNNVKIDGAVPVLITGSDDLED